MTYVWQGFIMLVLLILLSWSLEQADNYLFAHSRYNLCWED